MRFCTNSLGLQLEHICVHWRLRRGCSRAALSLMSTPQSSLERLRFLSDGRVCNRTKKPGSRRRRNFLYKSLWTMRSVEYSPLDSEVQNREERRKCSNHENQASDMCFNMLAVRHLGDRRVFELVPGRCKHRLGRLGNPIPRRGNVATHHGEMPNEHGVHHDDHLRWTVQFHGD